MVSCTGFVQRHASGDLAYFHKFSGLFRVYAQWPCCIFSELFSMSAMELMCFDRLHELACEAFGVGESLVLKSETTVLCIQPRVGVPTPTLRITTLGTGVVAKSSVDVDEQKFDSSALHGFEVAVL